MKKKSQMNNRDIAEKIASSLYYEEKISNKMLKIKIDEIQAILDELYSGEAKTVEMAKRLCQRFVDKVESGRAISKEIYSDCKKLLQRIGE